MTSSSFSAFRTTPALHKLTPTTMTTHATRKAHIATLAFLPLLMLAACSAPTENEDSASANASATKGRVGQAVTAVSLIEIQPAPFAHYFNVSGSIHTDRNAKVFPKTQGVVDRVVVNEGDFVRAGETILRIDNDALAKNRTELASRLGLATTVLERTERLWAEGIGSEIGLIEARSGVAGLKGALEAFDENVTSGDVVAPFDGVVDRIFVVRGEMASPMMPIARVIDLSNMYVRAAVSDHYVGAIRKGQNVRIIATGNNESDTTLATIGRVGQYIEPANRTFEVVIPLRSSARFLPNQFVSVGVNDLALDSAITLPAGSVLQDRAGRDFVFVASVQDDPGAHLTAHKRLLTTGVTQGNRLLITEGLQAGDRVILRGAHKLTDGAAITLID